MNFKVAILYSLPCLSFLIPWNMAIGVEVPEHIIDSLSSEVVMSRNSYDWNNPNSKVLIYFHTHRRSEGKGKR
jgi:hypothetical protein